jgi:RHS repeat-associated protein
MPQRDRETKDKTETSQPASTQAPAISVPKGGGAIKGIDEKFSVNPATGTASLSVPIFTSPSRGDFYPKLSLSYDSGAGNGPFGLGWSLSLPSIARKTDKGLPQYQDAEESDVFILSGAEDLVPELVDNNGKWERKPFDSPPSEPGFSIQRYRPRIEGLFARIERWTDQATGEIHWRSISKDNITTVYGKDNSSRIFDPNDPNFDPNDPQKPPTRIFSWLICESYDDKGNAIVYEYAAEDDDNVDRDQANERNRVRTANRYLKCIKYGNRTPRQAGEDLSQRKDWLFEVVFDYGEHRTYLKDQSINRTDPSFATVDPWPDRDDPFSSYRAGFEVRAYRLCRRVLMFHHFPNELDGVQDYLVRSTDLTYQQGPIASFITKIEQIGYVHKGDGTYLGKALPPLEFDYTQAEVDDTIHTIDAQSLENLPVGLDGARYQWLDLDGEGISGILTEQGEGWFYKPNLGGIRAERTPGGDPGQVQPAPTWVEDDSVRFGPVRLVDHKPSLADLSDNRGQFMDLAGDGQQDLVLLGEGLAGFYEREDGYWTTFTPFQSTPNVDWNDPNLRLVDLNGDGHADILVTNDQVFVWYASRGEAGFGPPEYMNKLHDEEDGPALVFADASQSIYLADMSGDGLVDIARIRNGEVCYWPNLGYGRFGAKVTMDHAPAFDAPDQFSQRRLRLADIDGSGTSDIIYLGREGVDLYRNQAGNSWSPPQRLTNFPRTDNVSHVTAVDLLGNGTACLVWSSPLPGANGQPMRYIDLMGGQKPHLLRTIKNNMGAETWLSYAASTRFYLADLAAGRPWITKLSFPVHVVERVETYDRISRNWFVTRYAYHHGYYDGVEREFRGFGFVEQWDTEEFNALKADADAKLGASANIDKASHVPPVVTRTWFHTGAYLDGRRISLQFEGEYYRESDLSESVPGLTDKQLRAMLLNDSVPPDGRQMSYGLSAEEIREAHRALKGSILRQEIYAIDGTDEEDRPYSVSERNYTLEVLQTQGQNRHAVFFAHPRETLDYHYERKLFDIKGKKRADPRVSHAMTLAVDNFGNVLRSAAIGYGRRYDSSDQTLTKDDRDKQKLTLVTYTENRYTDPVLVGEAYRAPLPCETRTYELHNVKPKSKEPDVTNLFRFEEMQEHVKSVSGGQYDLDYTDIHATGATLQHAYRRLVEHVRTLYRPDDMGDAQGDPKALLGLGRLESLALPGETYKLAFTPELLDVYSSKIALKDLKDILKDKGKYQDLDNDGLWWIPSGRVFYHPDSKATAANELDEAEKHFFLPRRYQDSFGHNTIVHYHNPSDSKVPRYDLLLTATRDAVGNEVKAKNNYRTLQPRLVTGPNGNQTEVAFDALGLLVGTALRGKNGEGDSLDGFKADLNEAEIDQFFSQPRLPSTSPQPSPAEPLLKQTTTRIIYDVTRYARYGEPVFAATLARETHASETLPPPGRLKIQVSFSYSDGFGREIQQKIQVEPGPLEAGGPDVDPRWVGSGWTVFNNKGKPVKKYEPFFDDTHDFRFGKKVGVSPTLFYDPLERVVATLHPNHSYEKVVFDPWRQVTYDMNDTLLRVDPKADPDVGDFFRRLPDDDYLPTWHALRTDPAHAAEAAKRWPDPKVRDAEASAADKAAKHADTPTVAHFDSLGRTFLTVADNGLDDQGAERKYPTRVELDIEGNQREVIDARGRVVMRYDYYMTGPEQEEDEDEAATNRIHQASMEAGERWVLNAAAGEPIYRWDSRGHQITQVYDELRRPTHLYVKRGKDGEQLAERTVYGEAHPDSKKSKKLNLRGQVFMQLDGAGLVTNEAYDFKGNPLSTSRRLAKTYQQRPDWSGVEPAFSADSLDLTAIKNALAELLEIETFTGRTAHDALNRPVQLIAPHSDQPGTKISVVQPGYNEANLLEEVHVWLELGAEPARPLDLDPATATLHPVKNIDYDAKGQRTRTDCGNGVTTTYEYDEETFRLIHIKTMRPSGLNGLAAQLFVNPATVQDLRYTYDPSGNITHIRDVALKTIHHNGQVVKPDLGYIYDAIYRLIQATGREHKGQAGQPSWPTWNDASKSADAMRGYTEHYEYDAVGNIQAIDHDADNGNGSWTRTYDYEEDSLTEPNSTAKSNRLTRTTVGKGPNKSVEEYTHDAHGNMIKMPHLPQMAWDFEDQLQMVDLGGGGTAYYAYDADGDRVRKVIHRHNGSPQKERIYLAGFEIYREYNGATGATDLERETLHVMDGERRIALVETKTRDAKAPPNAPPSRLVRYQFSNHLGSAVLELSQAAEVISYEEYFPYGGTSYQAVRKDIEVPTKRYRYTGQERDEETGLYYHGARYYAPWLGRWVSCDPTGLHRINNVEAAIGKGSDLNVYAYVEVNPVNFIDPTGRDTQLPEGRVRDPKADIAYWREVRQIANKAQESLDRRLKRVDDSYRNIEAFKQAVVSAKGMTQAANVVLVTSLAVAGGVTVLGTALGSAFTSTVGLSFVWQRGVMEGAIGAAGNLAFGEGPRYKRLLTGFAGGLFGGGVKLKALGTVINTIKSGLGGVTVETLYSKAISAFEDERTSFGEFARKALISTVISRFFSEVGAQRLHALFAKELRSLLRSSEEPSEQLLRLFTEKVSPEIFQSFATKTTKSFLVPGLGKAAKSFGPSKLKPLRVPVRKEPEVHQCKPSYFPYPANP